MITGSDVEDVILEGPIPSERILFVDQDTFDEAWEEA